MLAMRQRFAAPAAMRLAAFLFLRCYMAIVPAKNSALIITPSAPLTSDQHAAITSSIRAQLPVDIGVVILPHGFALTVIRSNQ